MEINSQDELLKYKMRIDQLSRDAKESYDKLQGFCNEIIFTQNRDSAEKVSSDLDDLSEYLLQILIKKTIENVNRSHTLLAAYEEYFHKLEKLIPDIKEEMDRD